MDHPNTRQAFRDALQGGNIEQLLQILQQLDYNLKSIQALSLDVGEVFTAAALCDKSGLVRECMKAGAVLDDLLVRIEGEKRLSAILGVARACIRHENYYPTLKLCLEYDHPDLTRLGNIAAQWGYPEAFQMLLDAGLDVNDDYEYHGDALTCAIRASRVSMVEFLLDHGAALDYEHLYYGRYTPLAVAAMFSTPEMITLLVSRGALISTSLALHCAANAGKVENVQTLLDLGSDIDENPTLDGGNWLWHWLWASESFLGTPLHYAVDNRHQKVVEYLLDHGANPTLRDYNGKNLLQRSAKKGERWTELEALLNRRGVDFSSA